VGAYDADLLVEEAILLELKTVRTFDDIHSAQCLNLKVCVLLNFATPKVQVKRLVHDF
jgi:GxxExxY protein